MDLPLDEIEAVPILLVVSGQSLIRNCSMLVEEDATDWSLKIDLVLLCSDCDL